MHYPADFDMYTQSKLAPSFGSSFAQSDSNFDKLRELDTFHTPSLRLTSTQSSVIAPEDIL